MKASIAVQNKATANHVMDIHQYLYKQVEHKVIPTIRYTQLLITSILQHS